MIERPKVPRNVERRLWAESIGYCMNPVCQTELIKEGVSIGEMAHVKAHRDGGDASFENLLLLCSNCHTEVDSSRTEVTTYQLREWKANRNGEIERRFAKRYISFEELKEAVTPILARNGQIFDSYGPENDAEVNPERHRLWLRFEGELIANNRRLEIILTKNKHLLHRENQGVVDIFTAHAREFMRTRGKKDIQRVHLFPQQLLSIFGIAEALVGFPPNLSALQNLISHLEQEERFISLQLGEDARLTYVDDGAEVVLKLKDRPRVQQVLWNGYFFRPHSTDVRIEDLVFLTKWLQANNIQYEFKNICDLTVLTLNDQYRVRLCYSYVLSLSDLHQMTLQKDDIVVNLHNWNGAPISEHAYEYADKIGVQLFDQNELFVFAHRSIK